MPTIHDLKKSRFLTKSDVVRPMLLTISGWHEENVAMTGEPEEKKFCLDFQEIEKPLVLNSTKGQIIAKITGQEDLDGWVGAKIVAFVDPNVSMGGRLVGGIGVRAPRPQAPLVAAPAPQPPIPASLSQRRPAPAPAPVVEDAELSEDDPEVPF